MTAFELITIVFEIYMQIFSAENARVTLLKVYLNSGNSIATENHIEITREFHESLIRS
jgi:hypothetical protein